MQNSSPVKLLLVRRTRTGFAVDVGLTCFTLSREGGMFSWCEGADKIACEAELYALLESGDGPVEVRQSNDTDPRLVVCEQGLHRVVWRAQFDLLDHHGKRWGEGLTEWTLYKEQRVVGVVSLRFINADLNAKILRAGLRLRGAKGERMESLLLKEGSLVRDEAEGAVSFDGPAVGLAAHGRYMVWPDGKSKEYVGGQGAWHGVGDHTPYYEDWGILSGQGWGDSGWNVGSGAAIYSDPDAGCMDMEFLGYDRGEDVPSVYPLQGQLLIVPENTDSVMTWREPTSIVVQGAQYRGYSRSSGAHMIYADGKEQWEFTVPPSRAPVAVHVYGLSHWGGWDVAANDIPISPQFINDGRGCDDPNGLQLGRFDDRHGPIIGRDDVPANRMILLLPPAKESRTVCAQAVAGLALSYLHWDDRQLYLIQSSANTKRNITQLVVRDGKLRNLCACHSDEVSIAAMPLYWYQCNSPTPYWGVEEVVDYVFRELGPKAIEFEVHSRNRYGCAEGTYHVRIPFHPRHVLVQVNAELNVKKAWSFDDLQLLNLFAEEFRDHQQWPHVFALAMDHDGGYMVKKPREGKQVVDGAFFADYTPPLLFAHYAADRGNVFLLQDQIEGPVTAQHVLCPHWIDSHYHVISSSGKLEAGDSVRGSYSLLIDRGQGWTTEAVKAIASTVIGGADLSEEIAGREKLQEGMS